MIRKVKVTDRIMPGVVSLDAGAWYSPLDGRVTAVVGTHTHVPTADERVLPNASACR